MPPEGGAVLPTALTKQKLLQKNLAKTPDQNDVTDIVKDKASHCPATATDTWRYRKTSQKLSLTSREAFESALKDSVSSPDLKGMEQTRKPDRCKSETALIKGGRPLSEESGKVTSCRKISFEPPDKSVLWDLSSDDEESILSAVGEENKPDEQTGDNNQNPDQDFFFVPSLLKKRQDDLLKMQTKIDPVLVKHRELEEQWHGVSMGLQTRQGFESELNRTTEWNLRKASWRPIRTVPLL